MLMWGRQIAKDIRKLHRVMEISHNLTGMVVTWVYTIVKINPTVHLGLTCLIVRKLYFKTNVSFKKKSSSFQVHPATLQIFLENGIRDKNVQLFIFGILRFRDLLLTYQLNSPERWI